jgi:hypothetical protein
VKIVEDLPYSVQVNVALAFNREKGYMAAEELVGWLKEKGFNIDIYEGLGARAIFVFPSDEDYTMFMLRWA